MKKLGWFGRYGFYEAVDYRRNPRSADGKAKNRRNLTIVRSWMAHHQGMSLLAIDNLLFNDRFQKYFHAEPSVQATELLLHERVPAAIAAEAADEGSGAASGRPCVCLGELTFFP